MVRFHGARQLVVFPRARRVAKNLTTLPLPPHTQQHQTPQQQTAYYLKYQNRRPEYIAAWWSVVNWEAASANFGAAKEGKLPEV
jgi:hypothetical protein